MLVSPLPPPGDAVNRLSKTLTIAALGCSTLATALPASGQPAEATASGRDRTVVEWNRFLLDLQAAPGAQPAVTHPTYDLAMVHAAIYDAAVSIDHGGAPYLDIAVHAPR